MDTKLIAKNPVAYHNFNIENKYEAGIVLSGTEIKSIRAGKVNLKDSYAGFKDGECYIYSMHISPYEHGNIYNKDPLRDRKLLLNKRELLKLYSKVKIDGYSLVPISLYFKGSLVKLELGVGKGKKLYDKRQDIANPRMFLFQCLIDLFLCIFCSVQKSLRGIFLPRRNTLIPD